MAQLFLARFTLVELSFFGNWMQMVTYIPKPDPSCCLLWFKKKKKKIAVYKILGIADQIKCFALFKWNACLVSTNTILLQETVFSSLL